MTPAAVAPPAIGPWTRAVTDSATMFRRQLRHLVRYPSLTVLLVAMPVVFLLLFVYVFGGTLGAGLGASKGTSASDPTGYYATFVLPGILLMAVANSATGTAISVATDMTEGIVARFRTMAIARASVLTGHVFGSVAQSLLSLVVVTAVGFAVGFSPDAGGADWLAALGLLLLVILALTWLSVAFGLVADSVETASNLPMFLVLLPFLSSGFVPTASMPAVLRVFAEYQPFTPIIDTLRGLLTSASVSASSVWAAVGWCVVAGAGSYLWSRRLYERRL